MTFDPSGTQDLQAGILQAKDYVVTATDHATAIANIVFQINLDTAAKLSRGKGALVFTPRGDRLGSVESIIGTLDRPIAVVKVFPEMRKEASEVQGRELYMG